MTEPDRNKVVPLRREETPLHERPDDELMLLARGGKDAAFEELVRRYQLRALSFATKYLGDLALANDAAQDAFVALYEALGRYHPRGKLKSFFFQILVNHCRMQARSAGTRKRALANLVDTPRRRPTLPDEQVLRQQRRREVQLAVDQLSDKLRTVALLRYSQDLSYKEIGEVLELPLGTIKSRLAAAMEKLKELLEGA